LAYFAGHYGGVLAVSFKSMQSFTLVAVCFDFLFGYKFDAFSTVFADLQVAL
jgi:hypothetical protein